MKKVNLGIVLLMFFASWYLIPYLPDKIPMHWNILGQVDNYMSKIPAVFIIPALSLIMLILFQILPTFDPKKEKYKLFKKEWDVIQVVFIGFFTYLQFIILYISLNPETKMIPLMFIGLGALFILLGNYLSKIRQNYFIGIKVPWTLASEDNWNKTHRFASWCFVVAGILTLAEAYFLWFAPIVFFGSIIIGTILPVIYSFLLYKKAADKMKYVYLALFLLIAAVFSIRLASGEDDWICRNGEWIRHGNPVAPMPGYVCK